MTQILIIGGGLSGLALARRLEDQGADYFLVEARGRFGGRILTEHEGNAAFDMGPAWFWPGQSRIARLVSGLGVEPFQQYSNGILTFEDESGQIQRGRGFSSMEGSLRLDGGFGALIAALSRQIPQSRKRSGAEVTSLTQTTSGIEAKCANGDMIKAKQVVLALPPRVAAEISFAPDLPAAAFAAMQSVPTWMAGQAKALAIYDTPFWRNAGLSGDASSRIGPMVEIHDASPKSGGPYGLFGFIGLPPLLRQDKEVLRQQVSVQFERLFGPAAASPRQLFIKDWAVDQQTATIADHAPLIAHPHYGLPEPIARLWNGSVKFAGTEVGTEFGGFLEGALEAADVAFQNLLNEHEAT